MAGESSTKVKIQETLIPPVRHPIKAARLLYTPPHYVLRGPIYMIFVISFGALIYSFWGRKDLLVEAPMTLQRESTTIQAIGGGLVYDLPAQANTYTKFNDLLVSIQEQTRIASESETESLEGQRSDLEKALNKTKDDYQSQLTQLKLQLQDLTTNRESNKVSLEGQIKQVQQQLDTAVRAKQRAQERLGLAQKQFARKKQLYNTRDITITDYEAAQEQVFDLEKSVDDMSSQIAEIQVQLSTTKDKLAKLLDLREMQRVQAQLQSTMERRDRDLKSIQDKIDLITNKLKEGQKLVEGVTFKDNLTVYRSNFDGLITDVHVTKGQLISPGQPLVTLVRDSAPLEGVAMVENKDIGHLHKGQDVKIKYFAYPYQDYGIQEGVITEIGTVPVAKSDNKYAVRIALRKETIRKRGDRPKQLEIGLQAIADIKVGEKRLIELVFSPISKFFAKSDENNQ